MKEPQSQTKSNSRDVPWIIPPGLISTVHSFISLYKTLGDNSPEMKRPPLMITGDTGVGKSLFVHIYETLYREDQPQREGIPEKRVVRINAAAFNENLILSELFGHVRGAFTGASRQKEGLVETADLLIIEEIGELSREVQAKLLTFIEDGYYYPVGSVQAKTAKDIQIVATTNKKKEDFRSDFYNRFFHFRVPSLHERREDVICHLAFLYPRLIRELIPSELMSLVAYNWPGNVREVETVVREILWKKEQDRDNAFYKTLPVLAITLSDSQTGFDWMDCIRLRQSLEMNGVDVVTLEKVLNVHGLGLDNKSSIHPFSNMSDHFEFSSSEDADNFDRRFNTLTVIIHEATRKISHGLHLYGALFMCGTSLNGSLFEVRKNKKLSCLLNPMLKSFGLEPEHEKLVLDIARYVIGKDPIRKVPLPTDGVLDYGPFICEVFGGIVEDPYPQPHANKKTDNLQQDSKDIPTDISEDELLGIYYRKLLKETHGVQKAAAARAGLGPDAFRKRLKKMGIMRKEDS